MIADRPAPGDPRMLGLRIQEARKARGMSQQDAAEGLGISRPTYIAIESGKRPLQAEEIIRISELLGRTVHDLLEQSEPIRNFVTHFRVAAARVSVGSADLDAAGSFLQRLCEDYLSLEKLCAAPLARNYPNIYKVDGRATREAAEETADAERKRLGIGDGPIRNLRDTLETDVGLRIFGLQLPARVAGLFLFTEQIGGCIAIQRRHPPGRRLWSLAHEYGHFLVHRYEAEVSVLPGEGYKPERERFADSFAESFLMPEMGVRRRFYDLAPANGQVTPATLLTLSELYGVSVQAMILRTENLKLLPSGTWEALQKRGFRPQEARALLGIQKGEDNPWLPQRYVNLAVQAFDDDLITEGELMNLLHTDREQTRNIVQRARQFPDLSMDGELGEIVLDLSVFLNRQTA